MKTSGRKTVKAATTSAPRASKVTSKTGASTSGNGNGNGMTATTATAVPSATEIAKRSYELFLARGGLDGHDVEDWLQAETELLGR